MSSISREKGKCAVSPSLSVLKDSAVANRESVIVCIYPCYISLTSTCPGVLPKRDASFLIINCGITKTVRPYTIPIAVNPTEVMYRLFSANHCATNTLENTVPSARQTRFHAVIDHILSLLKGLVSIGEDYLLVIKEKGEKSFPS